MSKLTGQMALTLIVFENTMQTYLCGKCRKELTTLLLTNDCDQWLVEIDHNKLFHDVTVAYLMPLRVTDLSSNDACYGQYHYA